MNKVKIGLVQMKASPDPAVNQSRAVKAVRDLAGSGAQIICLQELYRTLYFCQSENHDHFDLAEGTGESSSLAEWRRIARETACVLVIPFFEKRAEGIYHNSAAVIDADGSVCGLYRKMHIPDDPNFYEKFYFSPGDLGFRVFDTRYGRISVLVCWDQWFPEGARLAALQGARILFYPTAIGWHERDRAEYEAQHAAWQIIQRSHAVANEVFVASVNRTGREGDLTFWGRSFAAGPFGEILAEAAGDREENLLVECDLSRIEQTRRFWPFLRDRRTDAYGGLSSRFIDTSPE